MKKLCLLGLLGVALALTPACGDDDDTADGSGGAAGESGNAGGEGGELSDGEAACLELGELCHDADDGTGLGAECHELGHVGDGDACLERFEECKTYCEGQLGHGGAGGAGHAEGGAGHTEGGAGGEAHAEAGGSSGAR
jgi:hypothetical protein